MPYSNRFKEAFSTALINQRWDGQTDYQMNMTEQQIRRALRHLRKSDPTMHEIIGRVGPYLLHPQRNRFGMLVRSIISQQISVGAARSIRRRLEALVGPGPITAEKICRFREKQLRSAGLSPQKASYILDLAQKTVSGEVHFRNFHRLDDEQVIAELTKVKGIGRWTAQMFLIFSLGRPDVLAHDDLGLRSAIRHEYHLDELPNRNTMDQIARPWRPYASIASWYCWRSVICNGKVALKK